MNKRGKTVLDLEIDPVEGPVMQELFRKIVNDGYSCHRLAIWLNEQGLCTHGGAKFQASNVKRMVQHEGYTGYIITKGARSAYIPELKIIEPNIYEQAVEMVERARKSTVAKRNLPQSPDNDLLLAGNLYCACCGLRMSAFHQRDSYLKHDGTRVYYPRPKYFCYAKSQHIRDCTGQQIYKAQIVDEMVEKIAHDLFETIRATPKDHIIEKETAQKQKQLAEQERALQTKVQQAERTLERYDNELEKCIARASAFDEETLARNIRRAEQTMREAKEELAQARKARQNQKDEAKKVQDFYAEFQGWAEEYDTATIARKRVILSKLFSRVEVGTGYQVKVEINLSYKQFLETGRQAEKLKIT